MYRGEKEESFTGSLKAPAPPDPSGTFNLFCAVKGEAHPVGAETDEDVTTATENALRKVNFQQGTASL